MVLFVEIKFLASKPETDALARKQLGFPTLEM
jgi:hypothetical protein